MYKRYVLAEKAILPDMTFDDCLIKPGYCNGESITTQMNLAGLDLRLPIMSAAMDTVSEKEMAVAMAEAGGIAVIHKGRGMTIERQAKEVEFVREKGLQVAAAVGTYEEDKVRAGTLVEAGVSAIVVDTSRGWGKWSGEMVAWLRKNFKEMIIIGGNVACGDGAKFLEQAGASAVKVGIGPGSICTTRQKTGCGVPQLYAVYDAARALQGRIPVIADGGIKDTGDMIRAFFAGASAIMLGKMLAGVEESPGNVEMIHGQKMKKYRGMGSKKAMEEGSAGRYSLGEEDKEIPAAEGIESWVPYLGTCAEVMNEYKKGMCQGMGLIGVNNLMELWEKTEMTRISSSGIVEGKPHSVMEIHASAVR